jgi:hypothetical protein
MPVGSASGANLGAEFPFPEYEKLFNESYPATLGDLQRKISINSIPDRILKVYESQLIMERLMDYRKTSWVNLTLPRRVGSLQKLYRDHLAGRSTISFERALSTIRNDNSKDLEKVKNQEKPYTYELYLVEYACDLLHGIHNAKKQFLTRSWFIKNDNGSEMATSLTQLLSWFSDPRVSTITFEYRHMLTAKDCIPEQDTYILYSYIPYRTHQYPIDIDHLYISLRILEYLLAPENHMSIDETQRSRLLKLAEPDTQQLASSPKTDVDIQGSDTVTSSPESGTLKFDAMFKEIEGVLRSAESTRKTLANYEWMDSNELTMRINDVTDHFRFREEQIRSIAPLHELLLEVRNKTSAYDNNHRTTTTTTSGALTPWPRRR